MGVTSADEIGGHRLEIVMANNRQKQLPKSKGVEVGVVNTKFRLHNIFVY